VTLPRTVKALVLAATLAPFLAFLLPGAFMLAVSLGLWDYLAPLVDARLEVLAWNLVLALGGVFVALHLSLTVFYLWHIGRNRLLPAPLRIMSVPAIILAPLVFMPIYCILYVLPSAPLAPFGPANDTELPNPDGAPAGRAA
jgi:hypothetical protein